MTDLDIENYLTFLNSINGDMQKIFEYQKEYIHCKKGCAHCCKQGDYPMSEIEFEYLMSGFNNLEEKTKEIIKNNIENIKKEAKDSYICPFLIDNSCSVYEYRPIVCRTFGVLTEDSKGNPTFPLCTPLGLNFSAIYDKDKKHLSSELYYKGKFKNDPKIFRLSNKVVMNLPLAKKLNIQFGEAKRLIDFL